MVFLAGLLMAAQCTTGPCVQVRTDPLTHQIVITAHQGSPGGVVVPKPAPPPKPAVPVVNRISKPRLVVKAAPRVVYRPNTWVPYKAVPVVHRAYRPPVKRQTPRKPIVRAVAQVVQTAISLSDQISRLLPGSKILYQPANDAVTGIPVFFWSDTNSVFQVVTSILGIGVNVVMNPSYQWDFGDGSTFQTTVAGGPYPNNAITHTYKSPGIYTVQLDVSWAGSWATQGVWQPILGGSITQSATATIQVSPGPTDFTR